MPDSYKPHSTSSFAGGSPVVVFQPWPAGTSQAPLHAHAQSVVRIASRSAATNADTGHSPYGSSGGQPLTLLRGVTPSLTTMRIWGSGFASQDSTKEEKRVKKRTVWKMREGHTLELHVGCERRKMRSLEGTVDWDVVRRKGPIRGEIREIESRQDWSGLVNFGHTKEVKVVYHSRPLCHALRQRRYFGPGGMWRGCR